MKATILATLLLFWFWLTGLKAQEALPAAGGMASGYGGSASYTVGQVVYTSDNGTAGFATKGVQQSYKISVISGIEEAKNISLQCTVYPNPVNDILVLKIEGEVTKQYIASLHDINGKLLKGKNIESNETTIDMSNLPTSTYFLRVTIGHTLIKTFKIIKD